MLTVVLSNDHTGEDLYYTLLSLNRSASAMKPQVFVLGTDGIEFDRGAFAALDLHFVEGVKPRDVNAVSDAVKQASGRYIMFADSGDIFANDFCKVIGEFIDSASKKGESSRRCAAVVGFETIGYESVKKKAKRGFGSGGRLRTENVDLGFCPDQVLTETTGVLFDTKALLKAGLDTSCELSALKLAMAKLMGEKDGYERICNDLLKTCYPTTTDAVNFADMHRPEWYFNSLERYVLPMLKEVTRDGKAKEFVQYLALYELLYRYQYNLNSSDKHIVDSEKERFFGLCSSILSLMDDSIIFNYHNSQDYRFPTGMHLALFNTKYGAQIDSDYVIDNSSILRVYKDIVLMRSKNMKVIMEVLEHEDGVLRFEASVDDFLDMRNIGIKCFLNRREIKLTETYRYAHTKYFGVSANKRYTFRFEIGESELAEYNEICFYLCCGDFRLQIPMMTRRYTFGLSASVRSSYRMLGQGRRAIYFSDMNNVLVIGGLTPAKRLIREISLMLGMLLGAEKAPGMLVTRLMYWITRPFFKNKRIWLTYDKLYKGGDCGEYFYKYMMTRAKEDGITPAYVINRDAADIKRLHREGYRPLKFNSMKNRLYYMNAEAVFATHGGVHSFNGISNSRVKFVADLLHAEVTCIQHGLSVQQLAQELNKVYNNTKRYYCASKYEIKNLSHPIYGYEDKSALRLTGVPRYDGLHSHDMKQILITPTWRAYISMPPVMGQSRPYYPEFKNTNYYKFYYNLLTDPRLIETAHRTGYKLIYLLHPIISAQIVDYPDIDGVEIVPATTVDYEKILTESSLMLTDYSGVQFDFAYMRKPVVYYHPPELPPHYKEGGFFYDTMGFGEICTKHDEMVDCLCEYMENGCQIKPFYKERADDFFAYSDFNSCQRIYDDFKEYMGAKNR